MKVTTLTFHRHATTPPPLPSFPTQGRRSPTTPWGMIAK